MSNFVRFSLSFFLRLCGAFKDEGLRRFYFTAEEQRGCEKIENTRHFCQILRCSDVRRSKLSMRKMVKMPLLAIFSQPQRETQRGILQDRKQDRRQDNEQDGIGVC